MNTSKRTLITIAISVATGFVLGMLYAPDEGAETRRRIRKLKRKLACAVDNEADELTDREALKELSRSLHKQLDKINERLEKE